MKTHARYAYALVLTLAPFTGCGDDTESSDDTAEIGTYMAGHA